jgi:hexosaminidase
MGTMGMPIADWRLSVAAGSMALVITGCAAGPKPKAPQPSVPLPPQASAPPPAAPSAAAAPVVALVPRPAVLEVQSGAGFTFTPATVVVFAAADPAVAAAARQLSEWARRSTGMTLPTRAASSVTSLDTIELRVDAARTELGAEGYDLTIQTRLVTLTAAAPAGVFYGVQTLRQLLPYWSEYEALLFQQPRTVTLPALHIRDQPRYQWRGAMLDVARHFFVADDVKRYIDLLALHKMNRLHLHLADDQGWRIEIKKWPELTAKGGTTEVGGGPGGFYTQAQYADLVAYAAARFIMIVPEIDMPGHTNAALASYAELNCNGQAPPLFTGTDVGFSALCVDKELTYNFIDQVIAEIAALTPGPYFHMGGDEVKTLTPEKYRAFVELVQTIIQRHGKQMIGWDEVAAAKLSPSSIVQHWRPDAGKTELARAPHLILSPGDRTYLDMKYDRDTALGLSWAGLIPIKTAYDWDPSTVVPGASAGAVLGVEAPLWSETLANIRDVEFLAFPRLAAIAELGWSPADGHNWDSFRLRLGAQAPRWTALGINFYRAPEVPWKQMTNDK